MTRSTPSACPPVRLSAHTESSTHEETRTMATAIATEKQNATGAAAKNVGRVVQVIGPVLDIEFEPEHLP